MLFKKNLLLLVTTDFNLLNLLKLLITWKIIKEIIYHLYLSNDKLVSYWLWNDKLF